jgi:hypothetical protein
MYRYYNNTKKFRLTLIGLYCVGLIIYAVVLPGGWVFPAINGIFIFILLGPLHYFVLMRQKLRLVRRRAGSSAELVVSEDAIEILSSWGGGRLSWRQVEYTVEDENVFLVVSNQQRTFAILPKDQITEDIFAQIRKCTQAQAKIVEMR